MSERDTNAAVAMTLRDYFAAIVAGGLCARIEVIGDALNWQTSRMGPHIAEHSYLIADAMLAERAK